MNYSLVINTYDANNYIQSNTSKYFDNTGSTVQSGDSIYYYYHMVTGINELMTEDRSIVVYPNPATNQLTIHTSSFHNEAVTVSIMNVLGQETSPPAPLHKERGDAVIDV